MGGSLPGRKEEICILSFDKFDKVFNSLRCVLRVELNLWN